MAETGGTRYMEVSVDFLHHDRSEIDNSEDFSSVPLPQEVAMSGFLSLVAYRLLQLVSPASKTRLSRVLALMGK